MEQQLITHITPKISLFVDNCQYILVVKDNPTQAIKNGYHTYHRTIGDSFEEILAHMTRSNLADGKDKTMKEVALIVENTVFEIRKIFKPFEDLTIPKKN